MARVFKFSWSWDEEIEMVKASTSRLVAKSGIASEDVMSEASREVKSSSCKEVVKSKFVGEVAAKEVISHRKDDRDLVTKSGIVGGEGMSGISVDVAMSSSSKAVGKSELAREVASKEMVSRREMEREMARSGTSRSVAKFGSGVGKEGMSVTSKEVVMSSSSKEMDKSKFQIDSVALAETVVKEKQPEELDKADTNYNDENGNGLDDTFDWGEFEPPILSRRLKKRDFFGPKKRNSFICGDCGEKFATEVSRDMHLLVQHKKYTEDSDGDNDVEVAAKEVSDSLRRDRKVSAYSALLKNLLISNGFTAIGINLN